MALLVKDLFPCKPGDLSLIPSVNAERILVWWRVLVSLALEAGMGGSLGGWLVRLAG